MSLSYYNPSARRASMAGSLARFAYNNRDTLRNYAHRAYSSLSRRGRSRTVNGRRMRSRRRNYTSGVGVTTQHDASAIYRKKSMPRGKKRRWRKFVKRVNAVSEKELGSRTVVFNESLTNSNVTSGYQLCSTWCVYPNQSGTQWLRDLSEIYANENSSDPTASDGETVDATTKFIFQSAVMDLTFRNHSYLATTETLSGKMEVDVYELTMKRRSMDELTAVGNLTDALNNSSNSTKVIGGSGTHVNIFNRGVTPFDIPHALSRWGIKIHKKTKYFVESGGTFTYQVRDPGRYSLTREDMESVKGFNRPGMTRIVYFVTKMVPGVVVGNTSGDVVQEYIIGCTRKYMYKIEGMNDTRDLYDSGTYAFTGST